MGIHIIIMINYVLELGSARAWIHEFLCHFLMSVVNFDLTCTSPPKFAL